MKRLSLIIFLTVVSLVLVKISFVSAKENSEIPSGLKDKGPLTKITFIHYKKGYGKPAGVGKEKGTTCYAFLAKGARWKTTEGYEINPTNNDSLKSDFIQNVFNLAADEWDRRVIFPIFGANTINSEAVYRTDIVDDHNVAIFGSYPDPNVIAVTTVWGYFYGPPGTRQLIEWDMFLNDNFSWGDATQNQNLMDLQNIVTHELGHSAGMDDLYNAACSLETMYGYSTEGEIIKRDLNLGDIKGIQELYR